ncbi:MAG: hypothetical protein CL676_05370 [Bdellovibrionaceae bacterium]|nr:hypothetical protein [Pseudobdellovibrionaceae bacterium]|tara:strand:+ start:4291 stop:5355 length:1065 start_codon:yes stop_codon:yes gene_type:complete
MSYRFANPDILNLLYLIPILVILSVALRRRIRKQSHSVFSKKAWAWSTQSLKPGVIKWKFFFQFLSLTFVILAWARPQFGEGQQKVKSEGLEIALVVDVSTSMLAEDAKPSRLELVKRELRRFLESLGGDKVGLVAFAGSAVTLSPLTPDKSALYMYIDSLSTDAVSTQGTSFQKALEQAHRLLVRGGLENDEQTHVTKAVVLVSDGEDFSKEAKAQAENLKKDGIRIFSLLVGTEKGAPIPLRDNYGNLVGYKKDNQNKVILSEAKGESLKLISDLTGGSFKALVFGGQAIPRLVSELNQLEKSEFENMEMVQYNEVFQYFLFFGVLFFCWSLILRERRSAGTLWKGRFEVRL